MRPNAKYAVIHVTENMESTVIDSIVQNFVRKYLSSSSSMEAQCICYCWLTTETSTLAKAFYRKTDINSTIMHGQLLDSDKERNYERWITGDAPLMFATNAFGAACAYTAIGVLAPVHGLVLRILYCEIS